jgi:heme/copper-type cytochrome/quinol oxidase subunit 2
LYPSLITSPKTTADKARTDPTDKSIPAVIMTTHIPSAIIAIKEKFLVILNKFGPVANASAIVEKTKIIRINAILTQKTWSLNNALR